MGGLSLPASCQPSGLGQATPDSARFTPQVRGQQKGCNAVEQVEQAAACQEQQQ